jgi:hypothetical protein
VQPGPCIRRSPRCSHALHSAVTPISPDRPAGSMSIVHDFHDINSLDCLMTTAYIIEQAVG